MALAAGTLIAEAKSWIRSSLDLLWPRPCPGCAKTLEEGEIFCTHCEPLLPRIGEGRCEVCSAPLGDSMAGAICANCRDRDFHFVASLSTVVAHGAVREMIHRIKYGQERWLAHPLAHLLAETRHDERIPWQSISALVPVPLHSLRERERGYNQSELIAQALGGLMKKPVQTLLRRSRVTETQTHFDRVERMRNLRNAFFAIHREKIAGKHLVLVDDVFTTGSTLDECAKVLLANGAKAVWAVTAARA